MRLLIIFIIVIELMGCGGVGSGRDERRYRRDYDREGELPQGDVEQEISDTGKGVGDLWKNVNKYLENCESDIPNIPRTELDIWFEVTGLSKYNKLSQGRECLEQKLQEVTNRICQTKEDVYTQAQKYRNYDQRRERIQNGIDRIEEIHFRHQEWLQDQADRFYQRADAYAESSLRGEEYQAYANIFESESYVSCPYDRYGRSGGSRYGSSRSSNYRY